LLGRASVTLTLAAGLALFACGTLLPIEPEGNAADAGGASPDACSVDLSSSADNCGRCGRSCLGRACRDAMCEAHAGDGTIWRVAR
jgi:hypothetical protein